MKMSNAEMRESLVAMQEWVDLLYRDEKELDELVEVRELERNNWDPDRALALDETLTPTWWPTKDLTPSQRFRQFRSCLAAELRLEQPTPRLDAETSKLRMIALSLFRLHQDLLNGELPIRE